MIPRYRFYEETVLARRGTRPRTSPSHSIEWFPAFIVIMLQPVFKESDL